VASVWVHEREHTEQTMSQVMAAFRERFNKAPPRRATLLDLEKRAFALGSVKDRSRIGRKTTRLETCAAVAASMESSLMKSTRKRSSELGIPRSAMRDHMKKDLNVRPYRSTFVNELSDGDMDRRHESCRALLDTFSNAVSRSKVLFRDECAIYRSARDRNVVFWSKENPNFSQELERNPPHVMIWAGMTSDYLIGPYFFDGPVNAASYSAKLETWLIPQLRDRGLLDDVCAMFWTNIFQAAGLAVAHRHLRHHCHGHHVVLTLPHQAIRCGVLSREEWLRVATTTTKICAELWKTPFAQLFQKCSDVCHRGHGGASVCVSSIKVHLRIHWTCNQGVRKWFKSNYGSVLVGVRWLLAHPVCKQHCLSLGCPCQNSAHDTNNGIVGETSDRIVSWTWHYIMHHVQICLGHDIMCITSHQLSM